MMIEYTAWVNVPTHLKTKTQLSRLGLRPARDQQPAATFCSYVRGRSRPQFYDLYDVAVAVPKRAVSSAAAARLGDARQRSLELRTCCCGEVCPTNKYRRAYKTGDGQYVCDRCHDRRQAVAWARSVLDDPLAIVLDTETTGLNDDAEIVEIAAITVFTGETLLDTLVRPQGDIPAEAEAVHGIGAAEVATAPTWAEVWPEVRRLLTVASQVVTYNAAFDVRMVRQSCTRYGIEPGALNWECAMEWYAQWYGARYDRYSYKWQPLDGGHRARGDCYAALGKIKEMAEVSAGE